jgi:hypothetical protein
VVEITPLIPHVPVRSGKLLDSYAPSLTASFPPGDTPLYPTKLRLCGMVIPGIVNGRPVTQNSEALHSHINTSNLASCGERGRVRNNNTETDLPLPTCFGQGNCFDLPGKWPVELYLEFSNTHDVELFVLSELAPVTIGWKRVAVKAGYWLEAGIASFLSAFDAAKVGLKRLIHPAQHVLTTLEICEGEVTSSPDILQLFGLLGVGNGRFAHLPGIPTLCKGSVI